MSVPRPKHIGQRDCVDAFVFCTWAGRRWLAVVDRRDGLGWCTPGGGIEPGETAAEARDRELFEESGLRLPGAVWVVLPSRRVPDPRDTPDAWSVTTPHVHDLGEVDVLPPLHAGSDARDAAWFRADSPTDVAAEAAVHGGRVFVAHVAMIAEVIGGLR